MVTGIALVTVERKLLRQATEALLNIAGVTEVINKYGKTIVVEDDCKVSPFFLSFMNKALDSLSISVILLQKREGIEYDIRKAYEPVLYPVCGSADPGPYGAGNGGLYAAGGTGTVSKNRQRHEPGFRHRGRQSGEGCCRFRGSSHGRGTSHRLDRSGDRAGQPAEVPEARPGACGHLRSDPR